MTDQIRNFVESLSIPTPSVFYSSTSGYSTTNLSPLTITASLVAKSPATDTIVALVGLERVEISMSDVLSIEYDPSPPSIPLKDSAAVKLTLSDKTVVTLRKPLSEFTEATDLKPFVLANASEAPRYAVSRESALDREQAWARKLRLSDMLDSVNPPMTPLATSYSTPERTTVHTSTSSSYGTSQPDGGTRTDTMTDTMTDYQSDTKTDTRGEAYL